MIILPKPTPTRLIVVGDMEVPEGYTQVLADVRPIKAEAYYFDHVSVGIQGRCPCTAKSWFMMFYSKCVKPETPIIVADHDGEFLNWVRSNNPTWPVLNHVSTR